MMSTLIEATEQWLLNKLNLSPDVLSLRVDAKPPPTAGELFIAVYGVTNAAEQLDLNSGLDMVFDIGITVTKRTRYSPYDYTSRRELLSDCNAVGSILWKCIGWLHQEHDIPYNASTLLRKLYASADPFTEPLRFQNADSVPIFVGQEWFQPEFSADAAIRKATYPYAAMTMSCALGNARRMMHISALREEVRVT